MSSPFKVGIIGAGRIGKIHAENITYFMPQAKLAAIADVNMTKEMEAWALGLGVPKVSRDPSIIFSDPEIQAVVICSSTDTHADFVVQAARAGKHVFCEKPIDLTIPKVHAALEATKKAGVKLQVGLNRRFDHNFSHVRELVASGAVGNPEVVKITSRDPAPPPVAYVAVSGGIYLDMMIHDFDMARFLCGSEIEEVYATGAVLVDEGIGKAGDVDTAIVTLKFVNGALGIIDNSRRAAYGYDQRVEVFGSKGCAAADNDTQTTVKLSTEAGVSSDKPLYFFLQRYRDAYIAEMRAFIQAVAGNTETPVTGHDGLEDIRVGLAAKKSLAEKRPVKLSEIPME